MILLPAIDIRGGKAVRLLRGDYEQETIYDQDPLHAAQRWIREGARALHVVDLDGARQGEPVNLHHVERIAAAADVPVQVGGGLRSLQAVDGAFSAGAARVVLGTAALRDVDLLDAALEAYGDRIVVSVDVRGGKLAAGGWLEQTEIPAAEAIRRLVARGVCRFVYSSIERDGMLSGVDIDGVREAGSVVRGSFVYSGGVSSLDDLLTLAQLRQVNLRGVVVGKALYEERFGVAEAQAALDDGRQEHH